MTRRFQFSLGRLMAALSTVCVGAALLAAGMADSDRSCSTSLVGAIFLDWLIIGGVIGMLASQRPTIGMFRGICWAMALWIALAMLFGIV